MDVVIPALSVMIVLLLAALTAEWIAHERALGRIQTRIHVNGTRGKSSVTRLIAAGLRAKGMSVLGKTTGSSPRILDLEGKDRIIHRLSNASIGEQVRFMRYFSRMKPNAVVLECMAVQPQYQWVAEHRMVKSTHSVITNARLDHIDEMGYRLHDIASSLSNTIPFKGQVFTAEQDRLDVFQEVSQRRNSKLVAVSGDDLDPEDMAGFNHIEHPDNVALALAVCTSLGVQREAALNAMRQAVPDPGALRVWNLRKNGNRFKFVNAFAANDPQSTQTIWNMIKANPALDHEHSCAFLNTRSDRPSRTIQLLELILKDIKPDRLVVRGDRLDRFDRDYFDKMGDRVHTFSESAPPEKVISDILDLPNNTLIFGMGNIVGSGFTLLDALKNYRVSE